MIKVVIGPIDCVRDDLRKGGTLSLPGEHGVGFLIHVGMVYLRIYNCHFEHLRKTDYALILFLPFELCGELL